ncbi:MAG TPA: molybdopterin cofactor-binding domain-containing protein [Woeseiaceae bacterium]|nr:molybdopterin cofactor-binding domain-containing protein [Woeseiaceae bacterium]
MAKTRISRRHFLVAGGTVTGSLVLGLPLVNTARAGMADGTFGERQIGYFVEITPKGKVIIGSNQPEIGQGLRTALPMMVAEELDVAWEDIAIRQMPLGILKTADGYTWKYGGQGVGGSNGLRSNWQFMREVGATARHQLIRAAAARLGVSPEACSTKPGYVLCDARGGEIAYADLIEDAAKLDLPETAPPLKAFSEYQIIGTHRDTIDALDMVTGSTKYGLDTQVEGMRYAVIARSPILNGRVKAFDDVAAREVKGVLDVFTIEGPQPGEPYVILASGVAVVATSTWAAMKGRDALEIDWEPGPNAEDSTDKFWRENAAMLDTAGQIVTDDGDFDGAMGAADKVVTRRYEVPFVSHQPMEPQNCFAHVKEDSCHIIAPTQMPAGASRAAAEVTGLPRENIRIDMTKVGGGFGRRLTNDYVAEAAMISKQTGWPIQLVWSREDDVRNDYYRPGGLHELRAGVDSDGKLTAWTQRLASGSKYYRRPNMPDEDLWKPELYPDDFPRRFVDNFRLEYFHNAIGLPRGSWRAPAHTANAFVIQSFLDELAEEIGRDPLQLRLDLLGEEREIEYSGHGGPTFNPGRVARLLKFVAERIGYGEARPAGTGVGLAGHFTFGGYAAHAFEVTVNAEGELSIDRIVAAMDCGYAVHPNAVKAQIEGATIDGIGVALGQEITVRNGRVRQSNFHDYPLARIEQIPAEFEAHILNYDETPTGVGEIGIPPVAPALTNAIYSASGVRIRRLPIGNQLREALAS